MQPPYPAGTTALKQIVTADLQRGGSLSRRLAGYEERPAQIEMAQLVTQAITQPSHALLEAATGTGKGHAYLIPIVRSGKVALVSTANKTLQEQLFYKDIPFVQQHIQPFEAALVKGVGNYVCLDRLEEEQQQGLQFYTQDETFTRLVDLVTDPAATFNGDFETLDFQLAGDIRSKVCGDSDRCAWAKCQSFSACYIRQMREKAAHAQVIVVNHTLLLLNAAAGGAILPPHDLVVLDEAHHLEEEATRAFTSTVKPSQIFILLSVKTIRAHTPVHLQDDVTRLTGLVWRQLEQLMPLEGASRTPLVGPIQDGLRLSTLIGDLATALVAARPAGLDEREEILYNKLVKRTQNLAHNVRHVFSVGMPGEYVYYLERVVTPGQRVPPVIEVKAAPLDVAAFLKEQLFDKSTVICTSATLATVGPANPAQTSSTFAYFRRRVGLSEAEVIERVLPLSFDYQRNTLLYVPRDLPEPAYGAGQAAQAYTQGIARTMLSLVNASRGRAFLLFASRRMLDQAYAFMAPQLDYPLLRQGDMSRRELTRRFREEEGAILFGVKSFWEGVDIAGEALSLVVIDKLPFDPPDDPVHEARVGQRRARGENWFGTYVLPQAILRLKQGVGRLIRTREDRGVMAILDTRLHTKGYGKLVLDALPPARVTTEINDVESFFDQ